MKGSLNLFVIYNTHAINKKAHMNKLVLPMLTSSTKSLSSKAIKIHKHCFPPTFMASTILIFEFLIWKNPDFFGNTYLSHGVSTRALPVGPVARIKSMACFETKREYPWSVYEKRSPAYMDQIALSRIWWNKSGTKAKPSL